MSYWQRIFLQSKVNSGPYDGDRLPRQNWDWPQQTWFQKRLHYFRRTQQVLRCKDRPRLEVAPQSQCEYQKGKVAELSSF